MADGLCSSAKPSAVLRRHVAAAFMECPGDSDIAPEDVKQKRAWVGATASWSAAALCRFGGVKSAGGPAHSKTRRLIQPFRDSLRDSEVRAQLVEALIERRCF